MQEYYKKFVRYSNIYDESIGILGEEAYGVAIKAELDKQTGE